MKFTYYGHGCFLMETMGKKLLFDPFITGNPLAKDIIDIESIECDYILVSHGHGDHIMDAPAIGKRTGAQVIANYEVSNWLQAKELNCMPMNHGGKRTFDFGTLKLVNAVHTSALPDGSNGGDPVGFVLWNEEACFYYAGDTALTLDMKLIPMTCPKLDFAILPIGDHFTMGFEDATIAADFIECDKIVGVHYNTFGYIEINTDDAKEAFANKNKDLRLPEIGATIEF
ncbi:MAG: metal-dependent hydrolase [Bacteroidota bacterium]